MTISSTTVKNSYSGNGTLDTFNYTFKIFADSDLQVIIRDATATETVKTLTTHYTVTGAGNANGGNMTMQLNYVAPGAGGYVSGTFSGNMQSAGGMNVTISQGTFAIPIN